VPKTPITQADETYLVPLDWTGYPNYQTHMVMTFYAGASGWPQGANVTSSAGTGTASLVGLVEDPLAGATLARVYPTHRKEDGFMQEWLTLIGTVQVNLVPA
jgi:hypothetical protein